MTATRFHDRLDPATYEDDDGTVGLFERDPEEADSLWMSERLFRRLTTIGVAYELHMLSILNDFEDITFDAIRLESLLDEIAFAAARLDDAALLPVAQSMAKYLDDRLRRHAWHGSVVFSFD